MGDPEVWPKVLDTLEVFDLLEVLFDMLSEGRQIWKFFLKPANEALGGAMILEMLVLFGRLA